MIGNGGAYLEIFVYMWWAGAVFLAIYVARQLLRNKLDLKTAVFFYKTDYRDPFLWIGSILFTIAVIGRITINRLNSLH